MARSYPSFTTCAPPDAVFDLSEAFEIVKLLLHSALVGGGTGALIGAILSYALSEIVHLGCVLGSGFVLFLIAGVQEFKEWYRSRRLMCVDKLGESRCVVGTLADDATLSAFDGDRKIDMLLAPFIFRDEVADDSSSLDTLNCKDYFIAEILSHPELFGPGPADIKQTSQLTSYIDGLDGKTQKLLYMRVAHERMFHPSVPERHFQRHFYIKDSSQMSLEAFDKAPDDSLTASELNPLFRMEYRPPMAPFMHCELEGNRWEKWLNNVIAALFVTFAAYLVACALCVVFGAPELACSLLGGLLAAILGFLAWLLINYINDPDEGGAGQPDVGGDPASGDEMTVLPGDSMLVYGQWIMDTQHKNYFELHPIRAIYLICNATGMGDHPWEVVDDISGEYPRRELCPFAMEAVTAEDAEAMCALVTSAEEDDPIILRQVPTGSSLSMVAGFR